MEALADDAPEVVVRHWLNVNVTVHGAVNFAIRCVAGERCDADNSVVFDVKLVAELLWLVLHDVKVIETRSSVNSTIGKSRSWITEGLPVSSVKAMGGEGVK